MFLYPGGQGFSGLSMAKFHSYMGKIHPGNVNNFFILRTRRPLLDKHLDYMQGGLSSMARRE